MTHSKLTINSLTIELTRRCNTVCKHCVRGVAQNIDIDDEYIDSMLKQTDIINYLQFTGGEPTLCVKKMRYIFKKLIEYRIPVFNFQIITNGYIYNDDIVGVIRDYGKLVIMCREIACKKDTLPHYMNCLFLISTDEYHSEKALQIRHFKMYKKALAGYAQVKKYTEGNLCVRKGFAKNLPNATPVTRNNSMKNKKIEILDKSHTPICPMADSFRLIDNEQIQVLCALQLTVHGNLVPASLASDEYSVIDNLDVICNVKDCDIYKSILSYNASRTRCYKIINEAKEETKQYSAEHKKKTNNIFLDFIEFLSDKDMWNFLKDYPKDETEIVYINQSNGDIWCNIGGLVKRKE